jgi:hypothetical protein
MTEIFLQRWYIRVAIEHGILSLVEICIEIKITLSNIRKTAGRWTTNCHAFNSFNALRGAPKSSMEPSYLGKGRGHDVENITKVVDVALYVGGLV